MKSIGVIGAGTMGSGIAHVCAFAGFQTNLVDIRVELLEHAMNDIKKNLHRQVKKDTINHSEIRVILDKIQITTNYQRLSDCNIIIEAATENYRIKLDIFRDLNMICNNQHILASNTSSISITKIAKVTNHPENVIGMHFMNPVPIMKLVEVVRGKKTNDVYGRWEVLDSFKNNFG